MSSITGIILAGGGSRRMGQDKAGLSLGGITLLDRAVALVRDSVDVIIIAGPSREPLPVTKYAFVEDAFPKHGPLGGICAGLMASRADLNLVLPCDMPFLQRSFLDVLLTSVNEASASVFRVKRRLQPLPAVLRSDCLPVVEGLLKDDERAVRGLFEAVDTVFVDTEDSDSLFDIDSKEDLEWARRRIENA